MLNRQNLEAILRRRFPDATEEQRAAAANAVMQLSEESEDAFSRSTVGLQADRPGADSGQRDPHIE